MLWHQDMMTSWLHCHETIKSWHHEGIWYCSGLVSVCGCCTMSVGDNITPLYHNTMTIWHHDTITPWQHDTMTQWYYGTMAPIHHDTMTGLVSVCGCCTMRVGDNITALYHNTMTPWHNDIMTPWHQYTNTPWQAWYLFVAAAPWGWGTGSYSLTWGWLLRSTRRTSRRVTVLAKQLYFNTFHKAISLPMSTASGDRQRPHLMAERWVRGRKMGEREQEREFCLDCLHV